MARLLRVHGTASVLYMDSLIIASIKESMSCTIFCLFVYKRSGVSPRFRISLMFAKNSERRAVTTATTRMSAVRHRCEVRNIYNKVQKSSKAFFCFNVSQSVFVVIWRPVNIGITAADFFNAVKKTVTLVTMHFDNVLDCGTGKTVALFRVYKV